jgi:hypothetical protein
MTHTHILRRRQDQRIRHDTNPLEALSVRHDDVSVCDAYRDWYPSHDSDVPLKEFPFPY